MPLRKGDMVRIRRGKWRSDPELGVLLNCTYLAYENKYSKWRVLVGDEVREVWGSQIFPVFKGVQEEQA